MNTVCLSGKIQEYRIANKCIFVTVMIQGRHDTQWIDVTLFEHQAKFFSLYFEKGKYINIVGHLRKTNYNGNFKLECVADSIGFCGAKDVSPSIPEEWK